MSPRKPLLLPIIVTLLFAGICARLGVWQLGRLAERQLWNSHLEERLQAPPVPVASLPADSAEGHYRRIVAQGVYEFPGEVALAGRSSQGSPGVHLLTPLRLTDGSLVLVNRGWVYAPDAMTVDGARWRERVGDTVRVAGYAETWSGRETTPPPATQRAVRVLDSTAVARLVGAPIRPYYLVQTSDSAPSAVRPVRLGEPVLADGSHRSYAIQWFTFAIIAVVGGALLVREELVRRRGTA